MAEAFDRYVCGDPVPQMVYVATATAVEIGDPVGIATDGTLTLPSAVTWNTSLAQTQTDFAAIFAGVSAQKKVAAVARVYGNGEDNQLRIDTGGEFEANLQTAANTVNGVTFLGPAKDTGNALLNTLLVVVASAALAIAVCTETKTSATKVRCRPLSTRFRTST